MTATETLKEYKAKLAAMPNDKIVNAMHARKLAYTVLHETFGRDYALSRTNAIVAEHNRRFPLTSS